ncbi:translation initiation factor IF-2-like [Rousettus aegyptiacus]|uniref:translation initiation factor IF-2-like n=1 Tax=Rousettus aegyptiacus TaxID=9407 RepID=UPI00168D0CC2|nr:translation initiation factor IF-2-like [Rousettus aegyptiacus]XP_036076851.1 translation initiation factor IF-2-like [Rousettus aegyptiacus]
MAMAAALRPRLGKPPRAGPGAAGVGRAVRRLHPVTGPARGFRFPFADSSVAPTSDQPLCLGVRDRRRLRSAASASAGRTSSRARCSAARPAQTRPRALGPRRARRRRGAAGARGTNPGTKRFPLGPPRRSAPAAEAASQAARAPRPAPARSAALFRSLAGDPGTPGVEFPGTAVTRVGVARQHPARDPGISSSASAQGSSHERYL